MADTNTEEGWNLVVVFHGLCLIVPRDPMTVLLPKTKGAMEHIAWVEYDSRHESADGTPASASEPWKRHLIRGHDIVIDPNSADALDQTVPRTVFDFARHPNTALRRKAKKEGISKAPDAIVDARVRLTRGRFTCAAKGTCWSVDGSGTHEFTFAVCWQVDGIRDSQLNAKTELLTGAEPEKLPPLYPIGTSMILHVFHGTMEDFSRAPGKPGPGPSPSDVGKSPLHLHAYEPVLKSGTSTRPILLAKEPPCTAGDSTDWCTVDKRDVYLTTTFSCMMATAPADGG